MRETESKLGRLPTHKVETADAPWLISLSTRRTRGTVEANMAFLNRIFIVSLFAFASALHDATVKRQVHQLRDEYDFIIAGGGTSGLTVADRLSEAFPHSMAFPQRKAARRFTYIPRNRTRH